MTSQRDTLSVAVITLNEADRITALLESVAFADEIVIVDSGSEDATTELAVAHGARVIEKSWAGFTEQKNFALEQCTSDWILSLDGDEALSPALAAEIQEILSLKNQPFQAYDLPRLSRYLGRWIRHGGWYPDRKLRLIKRGKGSWQGDQVHEKLAAPGPIGHLNNNLLHFVYRDMADQIATINRFSALAAKERGPSGPAGLAVGVLHCLGKFLECYLWKRGFADGPAGLVIAMNSAWYVFLKHAKAWEKSIDPL